MGDIERNIKLVIEYEGTAYAGWQIQDSQPTVQQAITDAIKNVTGERVNLIGAGRTDTGVHALGQVANFKITHRLEPERYRDAINYYLPDDIRIQQSTEADAEFHARFSAKSRRYRYLASEYRSAIYRNLRMHQQLPVDFVKLQKAAETVVGDHDFTPFCVVASRKDNNHCEITHARWRKYGPLMIFEITGNRFLHSMVRSLVGAMLNLASEDPDRNPRNLTLERFADIILSGSQERNPFTAPARGLYLVSVGY